ncbi:unnamed protein product, partial [Closterium sp. NIES-53]
ISKFEVTEHAILSQVRRIPHGSPVPARIPRPLLCTTTHGWPKPKPKPQSLQAMPPQPHPPYLRISPALCCAPPPKGDPLLGAETQNLPRHPHSALFPPPHSHASPSSHSAFSTQPQPLPLAATAPLLPATALLPPATLSLLPAAAVSPGPTTLHPPPPLPLRPPTSAAPSPIGCPCL